MDPEPLIESAKRKARRRDPTGAASPEALDQLCSESLVFFEKVPEPPLYRRSHDPIREEAGALIEEAKSLLTRCYVAARQDEGEARGQRLAEAAAAHLRVLCHTAGGKLGPAETAWAEAQEAERRLTEDKRLWSRSDEELPAVYEKASGRSRFDPREDARVQVKLMCPSFSCRKVSDHALAVSHATHELTCPRCGYDSIAYLAESETSTVTPEGSGLRYAFRLQELGGAKSRLTFEEPAGARLAVGKRELLAFLYTPSRELRAVMNLEQGTVLWVRKGGCFVATVAFGEGAPELSVLRELRDRTLLASPVGRWAVRRYYRYGPAAARVVGHSPTLRRGVRGLLRATVAQLRRRGYGGQR